MKPRIFAGQDSHKKSQQTMSPPYPVNRHEYVRQYPASPDGQIPYRAVAVAFPVAQHPQQPERETIENPLEE